MRIPFDFDVPDDRQVRNLEQPNGFYFSILDCGYSELPACPPSSDVFLFAPGVSFITVTFVHPVAKQLINTLIYLAEGPFRDYVAVEISEAT